MLTINEYLPIASMALAGVIWFLRLEGRVNMQEKEMRVLSDIMGKLSEISERISFIEGSFRSHPPNENK